MGKARTMLAGVVCLLIADLAVQALCQWQFGSQPLKRRLEERKPSSRKQSARNKPRTKEETDKRRKEARERHAKRRREFLLEKDILSPTPELWAVIKPLLQKIRQLREQPESTARIYLTSRSSNSRGSPARPVSRWQWMTSWEDTPPNEWTEGQRTANKLIALVRNRRTSDEDFIRKMEALRLCRRQEVAIEKQKNIEEAISQTQQQLRSILNTRQEAALVLLRWL